MRAINFTLAVVLLAACGGPSGSMTVKTSGAEVASLGRYKTYMHAKTPVNEPEGYARGALQPVVLEKVRRDVDAQLQSKGYQLMDEGELVVRVSSGGRAVEDQPVGAAAAAGAPATVETEGALVIDLIERGSGKLVFHGLARDTVRGGHIEDQQLAQAVSKILAPVPVSTR